MGPLLTTIFHLSRCTRKAFIGHACLNLAKMISWKSATSAKPHTRKPIHLEKRKQKPDMWKVPFVMHYYRETTKTLVAYKVFYEHGTGLDDTPLSTCVMPSCDSNTRVQKIQAQVRELSPGADDWPNVCKQLWCGPMLAVRQSPMSGNPRRQTLELAPNHVLQRCKKVAKNTHRNG